MDQQVAQRRRVENTRIVDDGKTGQSVAHPQFLRLSGQVVQRSAGTLVGLRPVGQQIRIVDAAVTADLGERNSTVFQQLHEIRPGDVEQVGGLLGRERVLDGDQRHGVTLRHLVQDLGQQANGGHGYGQLFVAIVQAQPRGLAVTDDCGEPSTAFGRQPGFFRSGQARRLDGYERHGVIQSKGCSEGGWAVTYG